MFGGKAIKIEASEKKRAYMLQIPLGTLHLGAFMKRTFILILWLKCHSPSWQGGMHAGM